MEGHEPGIATQIINFEDIAFFRLPSDWMVGSEEGGGIAIFDDRPGSGTLRPWTEEYSFEDAAARDATVDVVHDGQPFEALDDRTTLSCSVRESEEGGDMLLLHQWIVAIRSGECRLRLVIFTHSLEAASAGSDDTHWELDAINLAVRGALYPDASPEAAT